MNNLLQPGHHPDAEQLSAFTDHALPPHEQQQMLAHLNACRDCRNRVYLAQQINPVKSPQSTPASLPHPRFAGWFSGWRLAFPAVALACLILLTFYLRKTPAPRNGATPMNMANTPAQPPIAAAPVKPLATPASLVSASPKSAPIPRRKRPQPVTSEQIAASAAASPSAPTAHDTPRSPLPPPNATASVGVNGIGGILGTITDPSGAAVPKAEVIATNTDTGVQTAKLTSSAGTYLISSLQPGPYNVEVVAKGFQRLLQENVTVDNASVLGLPLKLTVGNTTATVTVTDAPAMLNTTDATLGGTIENELYSSLPLSMNGGPRAATAFQYIMPGVQANASGTGANNGNSGIYGGTGATNLNENYLEGMATSNLSTQSTPTPSAKTAPIKPLPILPNKLSAVSVVERAGRTLAIDTAGTLFRSDDAGATWHIVPTQWQGRALTIRLAPPPSAQQPGAAKNTAGANSQPQAIAPLFELTTDSGVRYTSPDGQTWHRK
jgi:Carboxypeptidase regulatory-like domain/Putative zinc-finger